MENLTTMWSPSTLSPSTVPTLVSRRCALSQSGPESVNWPCTRLCEQYGNTGKALAHSDEQRNDDAHEPTCIRLGGSSVLIAACNLPVGWLKSFTVKSAPPAWNPFHLDLEVAEVVLEIAVGSVGVRAPSRSASCGAGRPNPDARWSMTGC